MREQSVMRVLLVLAAIHGATCWTRQAVPRSSVRPRCLITAQEDLPPDFELPPGFHESGRFGELPDLPGVGSRSKRTSKSRAKRNEVTEQARSLGAEKGYASIDDFAKDQLPVSRQPGQRRRKKEWNLAKRKPHKRDQRRQANGASVPPALSHAELLREATPVLSSAASDEGLDLVGVVLMLPPRGPTPSAFRCWIAPAADLDCEAIIPADALAQASSALRDALWLTIAGKPAISVIAVGNDLRSGRPLFDAHDFERFRGRRAQLTFREAHDGRRRLVGELVGTELAADGELCVVLHDESACAPISAPISKLLLGDKTSLHPLPDLAVATPPERDLRQEAAGAALEAKLAEMVADARAEEVELEDGRGGRG